MVRTLAPSSYDNFCKDCFELMLNLGAESEVSPAIATYLTSVRHVDVTVEAGCGYTVGDVVASGTFRTAMAGACDYDMSGVYNGDFHGSTGGSMRFFVVDPIPYLLTRGAVFTEGIYGRLPRGTPKASKSNSTDNTILSRVADRLAELNLQPPERIAYFSDQSPLLMHLNKYSSAENIRRYDLQHPEKSCRSWTTWNEQGDYLMQGCVGGVLVPEEGPLVHYVTNQRWIYTCCLDRYTEQMLTEGPISNYVLATEKPCLVTHHVEQLDSTAISQYRSNAIRVIALLQILNEDVRIPAGLEPLAWRADSAVICSIDNFDGRLSDQARLVLHRASLTNRLIIK